jgi:hypothetical protein
MEDIRTLYRDKKVSFSREYWKDFQYIVRVYDNKTRKELGDGYVFYSFYKLSPLKGLRKR